MIVYIFFGQMGSKIITMATNRFHRLIMGIKLSRQYNGSSADRNFFRLAGI